MVTFGEDNKERWCRFEYEFLPNFCFTCGKVGHIDKSCSIKLGRGETQQFGKWLKWTPGQKGSYSSEKGSWSGRRGSENRKYFSSGNGGAGSGSDRLTWRKDKIPNQDSLGLGNSKEREVMNPLKLIDATIVDASRNETTTKDAGCKKQLLFEIRKG
jgi:hypothetical protein